MPPKRAPNGALILTPWTRFSIAPDALVDALQTPVAVRGVRRGISQAAAATYAAHLRWLVPEAADARSLARALVAPTRDGMPPKADVLRARRSAWARFLAVVHLTPWRDAPWPALPARQPRRPRPKGLSLFRWADARTLGACIRWLCLRAEVAGLQIQAADLRMCGVADIVRRTGTSDALRISRFLAGARRGEPEVFLPLAEVDRLVLAAMLQVTWGGDISQIPVEMRLFASKGNGPLTPGNLAQLRADAGALGHAPRYFCVDDAMTDVIAAVCMAVGCTVVVPSAGVDAWGAALIACVSRIAVRGHGRERTLDPVRLLRIVRAFQGYERADLREMTLEALPVTPEMCADAAWLARERFAEINTRTFAAHYAMMRERRRLREAGIEVLPLEAPELTPGAPAQ